MKHFKFKKVLMVILIAAAATIVFGFAVMALWNAILPQVITGVKAISFVQALGILVLSKILFGGFGRGGAFARKRMEWKQQMEQKLAGMTPEEKEKFKAEWKNRCGSMRWGRQQKDAAAD
jgi:Ca2+/H+ antiporter, TMEM165/GDT1 family